MKSPIRLLSVLAAAAVGMLAAVQIAVVRAAEPFHQMLTGYMQRRGLMLGAFYFAEGTKLYFSSTFASPLTVSAVTNANPAQATSTAHGLADNDEILFDSGWEDATRTVYRADQQSANTFDFKGLNSLNTTFYPAAAGVGTVKKISAWVEMPQVLDFNVSGGDPRFTNIELLAARNGIQVPTGFNPTQATVTLAHDPALAGWLTMIDISRTLTPVALKFAVGGGAVSYGYGYLAVNETPRVARNQVNQVTAALAIIGRQISY